MSRPAISPVRPVRPVTPLLPFIPLWLGALALPGCPSPGDENPKVLWLAPDMTETRVKLVDAEPEPF